MATRRTQAGSTGRSRATTATSAVAAPTWDELAARLAGALERMPVDSFLILTTRPTDDGRTYYVQFAHVVDAEDRSTALRAEAVGSGYLPADAALTEAQEARLTALGWEAPEASDPARNHRIAWAMPAPFEEVAALAIRTLREVYGIASPAELRHVHEFFDRGEIRDPGLGIPAERRSRPRSRRRVRRTAADLAPFVEKALAGPLGVDAVVRDQDGDYPIRVGSTLIFVRLLEGMPPVVQVFAPVLRDVAASRELLDALNEINGRVRFARVFWANRQVIAVMELTGIDITVEQVAFACVELGNLADHLDDGLHGRFGGATMFPTRATLVN